MRNNIYPSLWFDQKAKEAAEFYCKVFNDSAITSESPLVVTFELSGQKFLCINGGPEFSLNPSVSIYTVCETEDELAAVWNRLLDNGSVLMPLDVYPWSRRYGWLSDRYGLNWQLTLRGSSDPVQKFTPALMFNGEVNGRSEEAMNFYTSLFRNSLIKDIHRYSDDDNDRSGNVKHGQFSLDDFGLIAMDSSYPHRFTFNESFSLVVECQTQPEIDFLWEKLTDGGKESQCGWLKDRYGFSWQIIPEILKELMKDPARAKRVTEAFLQMKKMEIEILVRV